MIILHLTLSRTKNTDDGSNNKIIKHRLRACDRCNFSELFCEAKAIQMRMNSRIKKQHSDLKIFNDFMSRGKISNAIRVLADEHKAACPHLPISKTVDRSSSFYATNILKGNPWSPTAFRANIRARFLTSPNIFGKISARFIR